MTVLAEIPGITNVIGGAIRDASDVALETVTEHIHESVNGAVKGLTEKLIEAMTRTTRISLDGDFGGLNDVRAQILGLSFTIMLGLLFMNVIRALASGEPGPVIRAALIDLPKAIALVTVYTTVAAILIGITDEFSNAILGDIPAAVGTIGATVTTESAISTSPVLLPTIFGILYMAGALFVWAALIIRTALLYIIITLAPLGYATVAHPGTRPIGRKTTETLIALITSKLGIAIAFRVGAGLVATADTNTDPTTGGDNLSLMFLGCVVIGLAAFMPWMILKAIPVLDSGDTVAGSERAPYRAAAAGIGTAVAVVSAGRLAGSSNSSSGTANNSAGASAGGGSVADSGAGSNIATALAARPAPPPPTPKSVRTDSGGVGQ